MSFNKVDKAELVRTADEDFAVDVDKSWPKAKVIEALEESGVTFAMYLQNNPDKAAKYSEVPENVVQTPAVKTAEPVVEEEERKLLVKMLRVNPLYQIGKYRWTQKHPYALVSEKDAEKILTQEEGFRQATPGELQEYYS